MILATQKPVFNNTSPSFHSLTGAIFVIAAALLHFKFMGRAIIGLNVGLIIAYLVWLFADDNKAHPPQRLISIYLIAIAVQCLHVIEEYAMDFQSRFPGLFGYSWSDDLFITFNLIWLFLFVGAAWGILNQFRLAYLVVWFFGIVGGIGNGLFHPAISLIQGRYFPGLVTSFVHLVVGLLLLRELTNPTQMTLVASGRVDS